MSDCRRECATAVAIVVVSAASVRGVSSPLQWIHNSSSTTAVLIVGVIR